MPITPLPQFEADVAEFEAEQADRLAYERLNAPKTIVIRYGLMKMIAELPYDGEAKPGCGSKLVAQTSRGTELGEMLTSTCPNAGCSKSVTRKEMLDYIDRSGGKHYPFSAKGKILRVATKEDLDAQAAIDTDRSQLRGRVSRIAKESGFGFKVVEAEQILGGELLTVYILSEHRVETHEFARAVQQSLGCRVTVRGVGARDEARLTADYERCGQHCCCKNFLKVLKPVSMRSAKQQKATLEPLKISGRCGRLMCCLRYEDQTYQDLKKNLPNRKKRVGTPEGDGIVIETQILTQLVLVELDGLARQRVAIPVEDLTDPEHATAPPIERPTMDRRRPPERRRKDEPRQRDDRAGAPTVGETKASAGPEDAAASPEAPPSGKKKRRRRRRKKNAGEAGADGGVSETGASPVSDGGEPRAAGGEATGQRDSGDDAPGAAKKKRRRRRRRRKNGGEGPQDGPGNDTSDGGGPPPPGASE